MKKGGKKKGGKNKDGAQRKKKNVAPEMTWKEALLAYNISLKEKTMEDVRFELKQLEDQNVRFKARNKRLKEDQVAAVSSLLKANKDFDKLHSEKDKITKDHVLKQMMSNWEAKRENEQKLIEIEEQLAKKGEEIEAQEKLLQYWKDYSDRGQHDHRKTICLLEQEIVDMNISFEEISAHLQSSLSRTKEEIDKQTTEILDKQKCIATEKAIAKMDKYSRREVIDNDWLTRETNIHRKETSDLFKSVERLEEENLKILSELFDCQVEDLHISRNFFMTQFAESDDLSKNTILEIDLQQMTHSKPSGPLVPCDRNNPGASVVQRSRPKSAIFKAVEDKIFFLEQLHASQIRDTPLADEPADDGEEYAHFDGLNGPEGSEDGDPFLEFHHFDDDDFDDYLKMGPLELKMLSVSGDQMPIHKPPTPADDIIKAKELRPDSWPVTHAMLRTVLHRSPRDEHEDAAQLVTAS